MEGGLRIKKRLNKVSLPYKPLVSIITVVKNGEKYLENAILSVINQTYENIEYIIIDGGSTDSTLDIIKKYEDKIDYWISEPDKGISDAFNKGIKLSKGEIIGILNSDDWYEKETVEEVIKIYVRNRDIGIIHGNLCVYKNDKPIFIAYPCTNYKVLLRDMCINHPTCFVSRKVYEEYGLYDTDLKYAMDYEFLLRVYLEGVRFIYIDKVLTNMRAGGRSNVFEKEAAQEVYRISMKYGTHKYLAYWHYILKLLKINIKILIGEDNVFVWIYRVIFSNKRALGKEENK